MLNTTSVFRFFIPCIFYMCYNKNYQQMRFFVLCLYFLFLVISVHVSCLHGSIIRGTSSCCFYATKWLMQCFVGRLRASADCFVLVTSVALQNACLRKGPLPEKKKYIYIYMEHLFLMFLDHTRRRSTVGRTPLDE